VVRILIIGGGIGGLTSAIALRAEGFDVEVIERDPTWSVYGVGIIQQSNVVRAMSQLGVLDSYLGASFGFDHVDIFAENGAHVARLAPPKLMPEYPAVVGIARPALHRVLGDHAMAAGARIRLGLSATAMDADGSGVSVKFSDGSAGRYELVVGADGLYSSTRQMLFAQAPAPAFTGQGVWRYNFPRPPEVVTLHAYDGPVGVGLMPLSQTLMYMYVVTAEPGNPRYARSGIAAVLRQKLRDAPPDIAAYAAQVTDDAAVVYRPLEVLLLTTEWHRGRIVLLGDAVHATTPHLGQGAGMAIEDSIVLAQELSRHGVSEQALRSYRERRFERCRYIVEHSKAIGDAQLGTGPAVDQARAVQEMYAVVSQPI
jgi:2-polyprenyl-6-methoxyphenol hydroxylase-like FAD-dependent oxidoreductase